MDTWDKYQAAKAWGIAPAYAMLLMRVLPEATLTVDGGKTKWVVPAGTEKPTKTTKRRGQK